MFDPREWRGLSQWQERRLAEQAAAGRNRLLLQGWAVQASFCLCFASLGPARLVPVTFAALMIAAGLVTAAVALVLGTRLEARHLTGFDAAALSIGTGLGLLIWLR